MEAEAEIFRFHRFRFHSFVTCLDSGRLAPSIDTLPQFISDHE
jgi:hypothetical protein